MQAKFTSLSIVLSVLFVSQLVGAIPKIDCSLVRCAAVECPLGQTAQIKPGTCCPTCVPCGANLVDSADDYISVTQPGKCCPTCVPPPDCSAVQCLACPEDTVAITVPGQCCPTCKPKPNCKDVLCLDCEDENRSENRSKSSDLNSLQQRNHPHTYAKACRAEPPTRRQGRRSLPTPGYLPLTYWNWSLSASRWYLSLLVDVWESDCHMGMRGKRDKWKKQPPACMLGHRKSLCDTAPITTPILSPCIEQDMVPTAEPMEDPRETVLSGATGQRSLRAASGPRVFHRRGGRTKGVDIQEQHSSSVARYGQDAMKLRRLLYRAAPDPPKNLDDDFWGDRSAAETRIAWLTLSPMWIRCYVAVWRSRPSALGVRYEVMLH
ncbi:hypothetical protein B0H14DRAFT_2605367 [Mycena olivaceomarginata]|nr:hypothetical protein B0H14DRAFT_2605367 [Mycena olivaceomarginata]